MTGQNSGARMPSTTAGFLRSPTQTPAWFCRWSRTEHATSTTSSPIRCTERDLLREHLHRKGIPTEIYYPYPLHLQPAFAYLGYKEGSLPRAEAAAREVVSLPIYPELTEISSQIVVNAVTRFFIDASVNAEREE